MNEKLRNSISQIFSGFSTRFVIGMSCIIGCFAIIGILLFHPIPKANEAVIYTAVGIILGYGGAAVQFYFGSSKNESDITKVDQAKRLESKTDSNA